MLDTSVKLNGLLAVSGDVVRVKLACTHPAQGMSRYSIEGEVEETESNVVVLTYVAIMKMLIVYLTAFGSV